MADKYDQDDRDAGAYRRTLVSQTLINERQLDKLYDVIFIQRIRFFILSFVLLLFIGAWCVFAYLALYQNKLYEIEHYAAIVNISAIGSLFALYELMNLILTSLQILREARRLARRQMRALKLAEIEL